MKSKKKIKKILKSIREKKITSLEEKMKKILEDLKLQFIREAPIKEKFRKTKYYDFYVYKENEYEFFIECHGNYWHPMIFKENEKPYIRENFKKLTKLQKKNIKNDKYKIKLAKKYNIPLLIFYADEIENNPEEVKNKILEKIKKKF